jgi:hypothetical protein
VTSNSQDSTPSPEGLPPCLKDALALLHGVHECAGQKLGPDPVRGVALHRLRDAGVTMGDLCALETLGYVAWLPHATPDRVAGPPLEAPTSDEAVWALTPSGTEVIRLLLRPPFPSSLEEQRARGADAQSQQSAIPVWDGALRELHWRGRLVKRFNQRAPNQEMILAAFEEEGWPPHIDDPLPQVPGIDAKQRLHDAIKNLNRHQTHRLLRFSGDGTGEGVRWGPLP